jgi:hypothetical protein
LLVSLAHKGHEHRIGVKAVEAKLKEASALKTTYTVYEVVV